MMNRLLVLSAARVKGVAEPVLAPDGRSVAFAVTTTDLPAIQRQTNVWRVDADGQNARALTVTDKRDSSPAFSPGGTVLAFLSTRSGDPRSSSCPSGAARRRRRPTSRAGWAPSASPPTASVSSSPPRCGPSAAPTLPAAGRRTRPWRRGR